MQKLILHGTDSSRFLPSKQENFRDAKLHFLHVSLLMYVHQGRQENVSGTDSDAVV
jgi:hypothetical protein